MLPIKRIRVVWAALALVLATLGFTDLVQVHVVGADDRCPRMPAGAMPMPNGFFVRLWEARQAEKAALDFFVIYRHEWLMDDAVPGPYGKFHLNRIASKLHDGPFKVVIQPDLAEPLNMVRRQEVINFLIAKGIPDAVERVIIAFPMAEGLYGDEAFRVYLRTLQGGQGGGVGTGGVGGGGLGLGGGGGGGGGGGLGGAVR